MSSKNLDISHADNGVLTLTVDNGTSLNLLDRATIAELAAVLRRLAQDESIRALVLRGAGDKAFLGGVDIGVMAGLDPSSAAAFITDLSNLCEAVRDFPVPTIACIQGWCIGGGLEFAAACDLRIGSGAARFSMPEVRIGIPSVIHARLLARLIGEGNMRWLVLTGATIDADTALRWGLLNQVAPVGALDAAVADATTEILACAPGALRSQKALLRSWEDPHIERGIKDSVAVFAGSYRGTEPQQLMQAFIDRKQKKGQKKG
ncbi:enoyl-CoA hydratase [Castellaniella sp.]|uniref:enoyl-CoA hydratase n=1 Tax=Castellaniella sp. TaxID=1955812 RepID=UPI00356AFE78